MSHQKIGPVDPGVGQKIDRNQIQDGGHSGHLGWAAELIIERNLPVVTVNKPQRNWINRPRRLSSNRWKPNERRSCMIIERNIPLVTPNKPRKNRINRPRRLSYNWQKPNVYRHRRIGYVMR
jgi:predicted nucleic acid-binding protein